MNMLVEKILSLKDDAAAQVGCSHVAILFQDGEIVTTKCGSLLWQRNLHPFRSPGISPELQAGLAVKFTTKYNGFGYMFFKPSDIENMKLLLEEYPPKEVGIEDESGTIVGVSVG